MLIERNYETTRWPKMDVTNVRTMELLRTLGLADGLREQGKRPPTLGDEMMGDEMMVTAKILSQPCRCSTTLLFRRTIQYRAW